MTDIQQPATAPDRLDCIMLLFNAVPYATLALMHLLLFTPHGLRFILVDNGSQDDVLSPLRRWLGDAHVYVRNDTNRGYQAGFNQALQLVTTEVAVCCSADHLVLPGWFSPLYALVLHHDFAWAAPTHRKGRYRLQEIVDGLRAPEPLQCELRDVFSPSCAVFRTADIRAVGPWDERYFLTYGADDFEVRFRAAGLKCGVVTNAVTHELGQQSTRCLGVEKAIDAMIADATLFRTQYADAPAVLANHPGIASIREEHRALLVQDKLDLWTAQEPGL